MILKKIITATVLLLLSITTFAEVKFGVTQVTAITTTGTQDITIAGFGTPKAVILWTSYAVTNATTKTGAHFNIGFSDGQAWTSLEGGAVSIESQDNLGTANSARAGRVGASFVYVISSFINKSEDARAFFSTWITNGIRIDWNNAIDTAVLVNALFIGGSDVSAYMGDFALGTQDTEIDITAPGFQPDLVIAVGAAIASTAASADSFLLSIGAATSSTQRSFGIYDADAVTTTDVRGTFSETYALDFRGAAAADNFSCDITGFDANGFSAYARRATGNNQRILYLALKFTGKTVALGTYDTATGTGNHAKTGLGITPDVLMLGMTYHTAADSVATDNKAGSVGLAALTSSVVSSLAVAIEDAQTTTDTQTMVDTKINHPDATGATGNVATLSSFDSGGFTLNYSNADSTSRKWWYVGVGSLAAPSTRRRIIIANTANDDYYYPMAVGF